LKKEWVERAKIKSKWKAQKRRENITTLRSGNPSLQEGAHSSDDGNEGGRGSPSRLASESSNRDSPEKTHSDSGSQDNADDTENDVMPTPPSLSPPRQRRNRNNKKDLVSQDKINSGDVGKSNDNASLRDLFRKAYSKSSLHTYKSDPLKKGRNAYAQAQSRGRDSLRGAAPGGSGRGQGQPNMKLRMNALLEKIKQDYT